MRIFAKPALAIVFGGFILCAETCLHADAVLRVSDAPLELPFHDWIAAVALMAAGIGARRAWTDTRRQYQAVAWAFMLSLLIGAFLSLLAEWVTPPDEVEWGLSEGTFLFVLGSLVVVAACALWGTLRNRDLARPW